MDKELKKIIDGMVLANQEAARNNGVKIYDQTDFDNVIIEFDNRKKNNDSVYEPPTSYDEGTGIPKINETPIVTPPAIEDTDEEVVEEEIVEDDIEETDWFKGFKEVKKKLEKKDTKKDIKESEKEKDEDYWLDDKGEPENFDLDTIEINKDSNEEIIDDIENNINDDKTILDKIELDNSFNSLKNQYKGTEFEGFEYKPSMLDPFTFKPLSLSDQKEVFLKEKTKVQDPFERIDITPYVNTPTDDGPKLSVAPIKIFKGLFDAKEREELYEVWSAKYKNFVPNIGYWMTAAQLQFSKMFDNYTGGESVMPDREIAGFFGGETAWISPSGEILSEKDVDMSGLIPNIKQRESLIERGYVHVYKESLQKVGAAYDAWLASKVEELFAIESLMVEVPKARVTTGFKEGDTSQFFGGALVAVFSVFETVLPAILTRGYSIVPQIAGPMYMDYNIERAKTLYPTLPPEDAMQKLLKDGKDEMLTPAILSTVAIVMERIGFKGIMNSFKGGAKQMSWIASIVSTGSKEGLTEWGQLGTEIINLEMAKGKTAEEALAIAWEYMASEEGLERFLMGFIGGGFLTGVGSGVKRSLIRDKSSMAVIQKNMKEQANLNIALLKAKTKAEKDLIEKNIIKKNKELLEFVEKEAKKAKFLSILEAEQLLILVKEKNRILAERREFEKNYFNFDRSAPDSIKVMAAYDSQLANIDAAMISIKNAANERMIDAAVKKGEQQVGKRIIQVYDTIAELEQVLLDLRIDGKPLTRVQIDKRLKSDGFYEPKLGKIFINKEVAVQTNAVTVVQHEIAHYVFGSALRDVEGNITPDGIKKIFGFMKLLNKKDLAFIMAKVGRNYDVSVVMEKGKPKLDKDGNFIYKDPNVLEEYLTAYVDAVTSKKIKINKIWLKAVGKDVEQQFKANGYDNIKFESADDVLFWLNRYTKDSLSDKKSPVKRVQAAVRDYTGLFSMTIDLKPKVDKLGSMTKEQWDNGGSDIAIANMYGDLDGVIKSKIPFERPPGFSEEDFIQATYVELIPHIRNFNPNENDSLWGWVMSQVQNKANNVFKTDDAGTKDKFDTSLEDEGSFVNEIESEEFIDVDMAIENDVTFSKLLDILGIERGGELYEKIKNGVQTIIPLELKNLEGKKFKTNIKDYFKAKLFADLKVLMGTPGSQQYQSFIKKNAKALYDLFPQEVFNKNFKNFIVKGKRLSPIEVDKAIADGLLPPYDPANTKYRESGPFIYTKKPYNEQEWVDSFLNIDRPAAKQNSLMDLFAWWLGSDATMEVINSKEFLEKNNVAEVTIATIGMKIDRGANVMFSNSNGEAVFMNSENTDVNSIQKLGDLVRWVSNNVGFDEANPEDLKIKLYSEFGWIDSKVIDLVVVLADTEAIINSDSKQFKTAVFEVYKKEGLGDVIDAIKDDGTVKYSEQAQKRIYDAAVIIANKLGPQVMNVIGYEILGFKNRVLDPAKKKLNPFYEKGKNKLDENGEPIGKYLKENGEFVPGEYYDKLEALKAQVNNADVTLPEGFKIKDVEKMNKAFKIFKDIEKILFDGQTTGKFETNLEWKQSQISKMSERIKDAGEANIELAKFIAKTMIEAGIDQAAIFHILQIQTSITGGFRALTTLDLITILEGSQKPDKNHPYFAQELEKAKTAVHGPKHKKAGQLKYDTPKKQFDAAILALGTKGEHVKANANTMAEIAKLDAEYRKDPSIDLDAELEIIFSKHSQLHTTKGVTSEIDDVGGNTNASDDLRVMLTPRRKDMFSPEGKGSEVVVAERTKDDALFSISDEFNKILQENEGIKKESVFSKAKANILGSKVVKFWDFIYPPSAYDLELFLYRILGKGAKGEKDMEFFKKNLLDPYNMAYAEIQKASQKALREYRDLVKRLPKVRKKLSKKVPGSKFTYDQAVRVSIWVDMGIDMQEMGLSKADQKILTDVVKNDAELTDFKNALENIPGQDGYIKPSVNWTVETIAYDLNMVINSVSRAKFLTEWKENADAIFSEENKRKLQVLYGKDYVEALEDMLYRMEFGRGKNSSSRIEMNWNNWVNNSVGAIMFFNFRSAVLQTISSINYVDWSDNNPAKAALAFANFPQFVKDVVYIFNSDYLKERRGGNKRTVNEAELSAWLKGKENKAKAILAFLLEKGFTPTQIADSFAISTGGATFYRNKIKAYIKKGLSKQEAEKAAWKDFLDKTEKGQQSSRPDLISQQQAGGLGRLILAFKNTPMQYNRLIIKAILDLKNGRGKTSENLSKIAYYGLIQNVIFTSLQTAIFASLGDEDEWDNRKERMANGMIDSILNGMGLTGAVAVTIKNGYLRYRKEKKRGFNADHTRTIIEFANLSPTIGSKLRKLYGAIRTEQLNKEAIEEMGFTIENPAFNSIANLISATTNIPLDRAVTIAQNLILASKDETEFWESTMLVLGWNAWDINLEPTSRKVQQEAKERKKLLKIKLKKLEDQQKKEQELKKKQEEQKKKGEPLTCSKCNRKALPGKTVCTVHEVKEQTKSGKEKQCSKIKKDKTRCKMMTANKSGKCYYHD